MKRSVVASLSLLVYACLAFSQITIPILPDEPMRGSWSISARDVSVVVRDQVASTSVTDELINHGKRMIEVEYLFPIPPGAAVDQMTLLVNGQELSATLLDAKQARKTYNDIVRRKKDPALLEYADYGLLKSSAFPLEPNKPAKILVHYDYICSRDGNLTEIIYPLSTGKYSARPIETLTFKADIESAADIVSVYSPTHEVKLDRKDSKRVMVTYEAERSRPKDDLVVFYSEESQDIGATLLTYWPDRTKDGYYMMLVSPNPRTAATAVAEKDIVIVMDKSGSMSGEKLEQARAAARFVITNLNDNDRFNLIYYDANVETVFETLREVSEQNIEIAMDRIDRITAGGSTNLHAALETAVGQCAEAQQSASKSPTAMRTAIILFLTDGLPTAGNTNEVDILSNTKVKNSAQARIFSFGVGYDVNIRLLDNLADENKGRSSYVQPAENIEAKVSALYNKIKNPVMTDVTTDIEAFKLTERCPVETGDLFEGDQLVQVGRIYSEPGSPFYMVKSRRAQTNLKVSGTYEKAACEFDYPVQVRFDDESNPYKFLERLWAVKRVDYLIDEIQLRGGDKELVDEVVRLGKAYGIVTPYTSFLADETTNLNDEQAMAEESMQAMDEVIINYQRPMAQLDAPAKSARIQQIETKSSASGGSISGVISKTPGFKIDAGGTIHYRGSSEYDALVKEEAVTVYNPNDPVRIVGNNTLYRKGEIWKAGNALDVDLEQDKDGIITVQRFTDEYEELINANSAEENEMLAAQQPGEKLLIRLRGQIYLIE